MSRRYRPDLPKPDAAGAADAPPSRDPPKPVQVPRERNRGGRPYSADPKVPISIRLDRAVVEKFRATGPGWQSRINEMLRNAELGGGDTS